MILVRLQGGLGNQMFQYAAGRRLAHSHKSILKLDNSWFENVFAVDSGRKYELHVFKIKEDIASQDEIERIKQNPKNILQRCYLKIIRGGFPHKQSYYLEQHVHFNPVVLKLNDNVYLEGYWQSEKYFEDIKDIIRYEFTVKHKPDTINEQTAHHITGVNAVSLHIRRGDYVSNPTTNKLHGTCSLEYYHNAVDIIAAKVSNPHFFIFSDDHEWARNNFKIDYPLTFVAHNNAGKNYEDMRLMSLCKHHIIANSSFSWWGAWLGRNPKKIVCAPRGWFKDKSLNTNDIIPSDWSRI